MSRGKRFARRGLSVLLSAIIVLSTVLGHLYVEAEHVHAAEGSGSTATGNFADGVVQEGVYYIKNVKSGKYMQVKDASTSSGKYIQQGTFTGENAQKFKIVSDGNGYYYIMTGTTDYSKCVDIDDDSKSNDKKVVQSTYEGKDAQKFKIELNDDGTFVFLTEVSDYKSGLQIYNASTSEDANVVQYTYSGNDEQKWIIETTMVSADVKEGEYFIKNVNSGLYLDVELDSAEHGADIQQWKFDGSVGQRFKIVKVGDYYAFKTAASDYANCMDVLDGSVQNGADVRQYAYFGGDMQLFKIVVNADGSYSFLSKISNGLQAVEVFDNGKNSGNNVGQWGYWGGATQKWVLEAYNDGSAEAPISQYKHIFDEHGENSDFYIIDGNLSSDKGSCKYDGDTYKKCLKLESSTKVTFTAPAAGTLTLVFGGSTDAGGQTILVDGKEKSIPNDEIFTIELSAGNHTIQQDEKQLFVYVMIYDITHVHEYTSSATTAPTCTAKGVRTYVCACGEGSYTEEIQEIGHIYSEEFTVDVEATENTDGSKSRHCMVQGCSSKIDVTVIPATGGGSGSGSGEGSGEVSKYEHIFAVHGIDSEFYTIDGNLSKSKGSATYNGTNYSTCLKVESETLITFTADKKGTLELVFGGNTSAAGKTILVDGNAYVVDATQTLVIELAAGNHTIEQDEEQIFMYAMVYTVGEGSGAGGGSGEGSRYEHIFAIEGKECANDFFTITGNLSKEDAFTYNGTEYGKSYDKNCLKIESDTSISFTAGTAGTLELYFGDSDSAVGEQIKIDGTSYELDANKKVTVELEAGNHTITKDDSVMLYVMVFSTGEVHEHVYASKVTTAATCEAKGVRTFTCACGDTKTEDIPATGHNYDEEYTIDVEPTEVATGEKSRHCLNEGCNSRTDITVLSKISKGGTQYEHIFERDRVTSDFYSFNTTALTTKYGNIVYEGETYGVALKLQRATKIKFTAEYPGTLTLGFNSSSAGNEITIDGEIYDLSENLVITVELGAGEHVIMKETGESYLFYMVYETEVIVNEGDVHVHSYTSEITKAATCTEEGVKTYTCSCGDTYTTNMAALGHTYEVRVIEPTCTATGSSTYTCIFCEDEYTNELPATGHSYIDEVTKEPTCTAEGVRTYTCLDCGDSYTEAVAMVPHDYESTYTVDVQPTANTTGSMSRHCKNCDAKTDVTVLPAGTGGSGGGSRYEHIFEIDGKDSDFYTIIGDNLADSKGTVEYEGKTYETALKVNSNMSVSFTATTKGTLTLGFCSTCAGNKISVDGTEYTLPEGGVFTIELEAGDHTILRVKNESYLYYMVFEEAGSSHTHDYTSSVTKVPTCAEEGVTTYVCLCGHSYTEPIAMVDHDYEDAYTIDVKATTKTEGSKSRHCKNCDARTDITVIPVITIENMEDEIIFENGSPNESYESIDVTWILESPDDAIVTLIYTTTGDKYPGCIVMNWGAQVDDQWNIGNTYSAGNPSDSVVTITMTVAELKESLGITEGSKVDYVTLSTYNNGTIIRLSVSGDGNLDDSGDIHIHVYSSSITKQVTCTENGQITYSCECGAAYMEPIVATGHVAGTPAEEGRVDATYEAPGYYYMVTRCTKCSEELARVEHTLDKLICNNHNYNAGVITTPPTCTTTGIKTYTCGICNGTKTEEVEALGHSYNSGVVTTQPTCTATGVKTFTCGTCGHSYTESVAAKGHNYDNGVITTNPTCTTEGVKTFTCQNDNSHTYTQAVSAKGHTPGTAKEENRVEATCEGAGSYNMVTRCTECNAIITSVPHTIDAKGHTNGAAVQENRVEASCETDGSYQSVVYCEVCDKKLSSTTVSIPKTGHNYDKGVVTTKPTCTVAGVKTYTCQNNKAHTYTEAVEPLGHTRGAVQTENYKAPSYTANGSYDEVVYCTVCKQELERKSYVIPMNECATHQYTSQVTKEATCTETGTLKNIFTVSLQSPFE
ncbi:MAG: RICIN domain-containing protein [Lachnospira sp.]|nr:RICIN domain-containing protein [Lachnospira sp.]